MKEKYYIQTKKPGIALMMNNRRTRTLLITLIIVSSASLFLGAQWMNSQKNLPDPAVAVQSSEIVKTAIPPTPAGTLEDETESPSTSLMNIEALRARDYPASDLTIEETLDAGLNYQRYIASYISDGSKIYGLLTIPIEQRPEDGYPTILFLHGFVPPDTYVTTADYVASQDGLARSGFVTFKPDLRGHGRSEGTAVGAHFSEAYVVDTLNALSALEIFDEVDPERMGVWGHSNGGLLGLRAIVITDKIKASVFWAGVVGSYEDMLETYYSRIDFLQRLAPMVIEEFGLPSENPKYWNRIDPFSYLDLVSGPVQLHHGTSDSSVPVELSVSLNAALLEAGKEAELFQYPGADHNLYGADFDAAMARTVEFFKLNLN